MPIHNKHGDWLRRAEDDKTAIQALLSLPQPLWELAAFHAQQMAEKYLKAFLIHRGWSLKKIHDLSELQTDALAFDPSLQDMADDCEKLTPFVMAGRYPGPTFFSRSTCESAIAAAERIRAEILKRLPGSYV